MLADWKRRGAMVGVILGLAVAGLGTGSARADSWPCNDTPSEDTTVRNGDTFVGFEDYLNRFGDGNYALWVCVAPTGGEAAQRWAVVWADTTPGSSGTGVTLNATSCRLPGGFGGGSQLPTTCTDQTNQLGATGASVNPTTSVNGLGGAAGTGASVGHGSGTCTYVNGSATCGPASSLASVTADERDAIVTPHVNTTCVTIGGSCVTTAPSGVGVRAGDGNRTTPTARVEVAGIPASESIDGCYGFNAPASC